MSTSGHCLEAGAQSCQLTVVAKNILSHFPLDYTVSLKPLRNFETIETIAWRPLNSFSLLRNGFQIAAQDGGVR